MNAKTTVGIAFTVSIAIAATCSVVWNRRDKAAVATAVKTSDELILKEPSDPKSAGELARQKIIWILSNNSELPAEVKLGAVALSDEISKIFPIYYGGTPAEFAAHQASLGLTVDPMWTDPRGEAIWAGMTRPVRGRPVGLDNIQVVVRKPIGATKLSDPARPDGKSTVRAQRSPESLGEFSPLLASVLVVDVIIPIRSITLSDTEFAGNFILTLSRRAKDGQWLVVETAIQGHPKDSGAISSPPP